MADTGPSQKPSEQEECTDPIDSHNQDSSLITTLKDLIDDDVYQGLKRHFFMNGKGRRPDLPRGLSVTNELLVQLYILKEEGQCSFRTLKSWLEKLEGSTAAVTEGRIKHKIQTVLDAFQRTPPEQRQMFFREEINFHALAEPLTALGLNRLHLMNVESYNKPPSECITNNVAVALDQFRFREQETAQFVIRWLKILCNSCATLNDKQLRTKLQVVLKKAKLLSRNKKNNELETFLSNPFFEKINPSLTPVADFNENNAKVLVLDCKECKVKSSAIRMLEKENEHLLSKLEEQKNELNIKSEIIKVDMKELRASKDNLERNCEELKSNLMTVRAEKKQLLEEIETIKKSHLYKSNYKLRQDLVETKQQQDSLMKDLLTERSKTDSLKSSFNKLKLKIKNEQSLKSGYKTSLNNVQKQNNDLKKMLMIEKESDDVQIREFSRSHRYSDDIRKTFYALQGEANVPATNCSEVVATVARNLFKANISESDLPCNTSSLNFSNEAHVIAKQHVVDEINKSEHFVYASDGTSRQKASFLEQHIILPNGRKLSLGFSELACEDSETLLEKCIGAFKEIVEIYCLVEDVDRDMLFKDVIKKMKCLLSDRAAVIKAFDDKLHAYKQSIMEDDTEDVSTHFLFCNAHFLLALSSGAEEGIKSVEEDQVSAAGSSKLGRDSQVKFSRFAAQSECAALRLIRTASEVFGPRCDEKSGCRQNWLAFCSTKKKKSLFTSYRANRFNNLFLNATAVLYHKEDIEEFLCDFNSHDNLKLQSVLADVKDKRILTSIAVLSFLHVFFTDPYWQLMNSTKSYADFPEYVKQMKTQLSSWIEDAGRNHLNLIQASSVFEDFAESELYSSVILNFLRSNFLTGISVDFNSCFLKVIERYTIALDRQLGEFLDGGLWGGHIDNSVKSILQTCPLTNLTGERLFGDLDYCLNTRRNASLFFRSTRNMWKHNRTERFMRKQSAPISKKLIKKAIRYGPEFKRRSVEIKRAILKKRIVKCEEHIKKKQEKAIKVLERKRAALDAVLGRDMLMITSKDELDEVYSGPQALQRLREQIRFRNLVGGEKIRITGNKKVLYDRLLEHIS